jgi:hypothetical protein
MVKKTEHIAWLILALAFISCIGLAVGVPLSSRWLLLNSMRPLTIVLQPRGGSITYQAAGSNTTILVEETMEIQPRGEVQLDEEGDGLLLFYHPDQSDSPIATVQLYGRTQLAIGDARTPRFQISQHPHRIQLEVERANMSVSVTGNGRDAKFHVRSPHGLVAMEEGSFALVIEESTTSLSVNAGRASIPDPATGEQLDIWPLQRTQLTASGLGEVYVGARDIMNNRNGDFEEPLETYWAIKTTKGFEDQPDGLVRQTRVEENRYLVLFTRVGVGPAETGIEQIIDRNIRGINSLYIRATIRVDTQTLPVCGTYGTECPVMIRIRFADQSSGQLREWIQGFYFKEGDNETFCMGCEWRAKHIQVVQGAWYDYESPDLLPLLREQGIEPASIYSIEIYASGHAYGSAIDKIAVLVDE